MASAFSSVHPFSKWSTGNWEFRQPGGYSVKTEKGKGGIRVSDEGVEGWGVQTKQPQEQQYLWRIITLIFARSQISSNRFMAEKISLTPSSTGTEMMDRQAVNKGEWEWEIESIMSEKVVKFKGVQPTINKHTKLQYITSLHNTQYLEYSTSQYITTQHSTAK